MTTTKFSIKKFFNEMATSGSYIVTSNQEVYSNAITLTTLDKKTHFAVEMDENEDYHITVSGINATEVKYFVSKDGYVNGNLHTIIEQRYEESLN